MYLPEEIIQIEILPYLQICELNTFQLVNKKWYKICHKMIKKYCQFEIDMLGVGLFAGQFRTTIKIKITTKDIRLCFYDDIMSKYKNEGFLEFLKEDSTDVEFGEIYLQQSEKHLIIIIKPQEHVVNKIYIKKKYCEKAMKQVAKELETEMKYCLRSE